MAGMLLAGGLLLAGTGNAAMYRWVNAQGQVVYSQFPPDNGAPTKVIAPPPPPATPPGVAAQRTTNELKQLADSEKASQARAKKAAKKAASQARLKQACANARHNLTVIQEHPHARFRAPGGTYRRFTPEQQDSQISQLKTFIDSKCQ